MNPTESLLDQALALMIAGMGSVFVFLTLLVFATKLLSALARRLQPAPPADAPMATAVTAEALAAAAAAVQRYRQDHEKAQ